MSKRTPIVAAGVGNTSLQFAVMLDQSPVPVPRRHHVFPVVDGVPQFEPAHPDDYQRWFVASVNDQGAEHLRRWAESLGAESFQLLTAGDFPIEIDVTHPERVGTDRLAAAVAANSLRDEQAPAIVIDAGTAMTVNAISKSGVFLGGAILPGVATSLVALAKATQQLPQVEFHFRSPAESPEPIGKETHDAIRSGVYWGLVGAAQELARRMSVVTNEPTQLFVTGGFGPWLAAELTAMASQHGYAACQYVPHLVLSGVGIAAAEL